MESDLMRVLNWDIYYVTTFDFIQHFIAQGLVFTNDLIEKDGKTSKPSAQIVQNTIKFAEFYAEMCL